MSADNKVDLQPALVLHQRPYRESSLLLEVFGIDTGRVGLIAKGGRRPKSPLRAQLIPFRPLLLSWRGRGDLGLVVGAEPDGAAPVIPPAAIVSGLYLNELLVRLLHRHDPHPELFLQYRRTLSALASPDRPLEQSLRLFEKRLLDAVGYGLMLDRVAGTGAPVEPEAHYHYVADRGPVEAGGKEEAAGVRVKGSTLLALASERSMDAAALREAKHLMRTAINMHLEGRPLVSRALYPRKSAPPARAGGAEHEA
ncbi:MAG TPA: DNA repair protein RecO [Gammaproteobacteria bacterium]|nr:DNA repair protein RecO [Gammaproteobacteria bacterium]